MKRIAAVCGFTGTLLCNSCAANGDSVSSKDEIVEEETLAILKPEAVEKKIVGEILTRIEKAGLNIKCMKKTRLTKEQAKAFYIEHSKRPFYDHLSSYMSSGPIVVAVLSGKDAVARYRKLEGATDPKKAEPGTLRRDFGEDRERNAVHGSDGVESAKRETKFFFSDAEISGAAAQTVATR